MHIKNLLTVQAFDENGESYLNLPVQQHTVAPFLEQLKKIIGDSNYLTFTKNQKKRDRNAHHITFVTPPEYQKISPAIPGEFIGYPVTVHLLGIGRITEIDNEVYFIVCQCPELNSLRQYLNLPEADFHITLGFKKSDIFNRPKDPSSLIFPFNIAEVGPCF